MLWNGSDIKSRNGVGFVLSKEIDPISEVMFINDRMIRVDVIVGRKREAD